MRGILREEITTLRRHFAYLDWLRGGASFLVFSYHARNLLFVDASANPGGLGLLGKAFYFITGFGHLAVIVFFALSGCVIANVIFSALERGDWNWQGYLLARVTRLWVVILPGLILTCVWDLAAWHFFPDSLPHAVPGYANMLAVSDRQHLGIGTFFTNLFFLQTIVGPTYGSNGALWSLANEFWYYIFFPLALVGAGASRSWLARTAGVALAGIGLAAAGGEIAQLFPVWLMGAVAYFCWFRGLRVGAIAGRWASIATFILAGAICSLIRARAAQAGHPSDDFLAGMSIMLFLFFLLNTQPPANVWLERLLSGISRMSFTLYVVHTPILVFIACFLMRGRSERWAYDLEHVGYLATIMAFVLAYAWLVYRVTEAQSARIRIFLEKHLGITERGATPQKDLVETNPRA